MLLRAALLTAAAAGAGAAPAHFAADAADLIRAVTRTPGAALRGATVADVAAKLNRALSGAAGLRTEPCEAADVGRLGGVLTALDALRDDGLAELYRRRGDPRAVFAGAASLRDRVGAEDAAAAASGALRGVVAATRCRLAAMWYTHHLSRAARRAFAERHTLPLMPVAQPPRPAAAGGAAAARVVRWHDAANACSRCHYDGSNGAAATAPPAPAGTTPPTPLASNVNYTIYAGTSGCCSPQQNWTQKRTIDRRFDHVPPQHLEINEVCDDGKGDAGTCCILEPCKTDSSSPLRQYQGCHFLYNGTTLWEWYPDIQKCAKLVDGAGGVTNLWPVISRAGTTDLGAVTMADVPDVTRNRTCHAFGSKSDVGFPPGGGGLWQRDDGTMCKQSFGVGVDNYADYVETPELTGGLDSVLPSYCPAQDSAAVLPYPSSMGDQSWVCTRCWLKGTCPTS